MLTNRLISCVSVLLIVTATCSVARAAKESAGVGDSNFHLRGGFDNSRIQFTRGKTGHVAFIGGSITQMNGYRPMVSAMLTKRFGDTKFTFTDAGISSTCSTTGAGRLTSDVLSKGPVDLFFIEFAVNDDQDAGHTLRECIRGMEGIIRHARTYNPNMDIVITYFVNQGMIKTISAGKNPIPMAGHKKVAECYSISTIDLAREVTQQIKGKTLTWRKFGGVHPGPYGNAMCTKMIEKLLDKAWAKPLAAGAKKTAHKMPAKPIDPQSYFNGRFVAPAKAKVKSGWKLGVPDWKSLKGGKRGRFTKLDLLSADDAGAELTLEFTGKAIGAYVLAGPDAGVLEATIDGGKPVTVDLYHRYSRGLHYPRTVMFDADLKPGKHTLKLKTATIEGRKQGGQAARILQFVAN
ncbi:MAG: GDSL-type esterase/lipase family protein [Phycisphaerae bacterium]|jgi:lysophospholipase L1-like esterase|nr:GDSL-type esterase/lipase family protein [Phycisphaerae bacterium]